MVGMTREDLLATPPITVITRESRAQFEAINRQIAAEGALSVDSTLLHKSQEPIPVRMFMKLQPHEDGDRMLTEFHDLRPFREFEAKLRRAQDQTRSLITLVNEEKRQIAENIQGNIGLVALPLIDQLRTGATDAQKELLAILAGRIRRVAGRLGIAADLGPSGANLTRRQILICEMIRDGMSSKEIAAGMGCSPSTINNHRNAIRKKLGLAGKGVNLQGYLNRDNRVVDVQEEELPEIGETLIERLL